ncbi:DUF3108 domain-containing protein [Pararhizobium mangrovi]|nr:DUF3108 domain-containing protein [Pararhizobium mangrovi]
MRFSGSITGAALAAFAVATTFSSSANAAQTRTAYAIRFWGLTVARATFTTKTDGKHYTIDGDLESAGLAKIFDSTHGTSHVTGAILPERLQAQSYRMQYTSGKKHAKTTMRFDDGAVRSVERKPKDKDDKQDDWVPVEENDLRNVVEPVSALVLPAGEPACPRTIRLFDGETLAELKLKADGHKSVSTDAYSGDVLVCTVNFTPLAGYRRSNDGINYLKKADDISVWFARTKGSDFYAPVYARVPTRIGWVTVSATQFGS